jgi:hypothetical protein
MFTSRHDDDEDADLADKSAAGLSDDVDKAKETMEGEPAGDAMKERHTRLMEMLEDERDRQADERFQMSKDADYEDGLQWEPEDAQELLERGQAPLVYNRVKPIVEWVLGTEKRTRVDWKVLPRERDDEVGAEVKTKVLKFVSDVNRAPFKRSAAFKEAVISGLGWLEDSASRDPSGEPIYSGQVSWRDIYRDSRSKELDYSDARYVFRQKVVDLDVAKAMFPKAKMHLETMTRDGESESDEDDIWYLGERLTNTQDLDSRTRFGERSGVVSTTYVDTGRRETVRLLECWYRVPESQQVFANGPAIGQVFDPANPEHAALEAQGAHIMDDVRMQTRVMIATEDMPLWDGPSPYKHDQFPFTPIWCYRRGRDGAPYGVVRQIRDPQDDFNKRRSKALHILSTNRVVADNNSVDDPELLRREASRADGVILKRPGSFIEFQKPTAELAGNLELMQHNEALMQDISGVQSELLGRQTNAQSGKAIIARQEQGSMVTATIFDNLRLAIQLSGEKQLSLIEQFYVEPKVVRIVGQRAPTEWIEINQVDESTGRVLNDITATKADFIVSEQDYRANMQQAAAEVLGDVLTKVGAFAPQIVATVLDLWVDLLDVPNKDEFAARIRKATGQRDPTRQPTPEEQQAEQAAMQKQSEMDELQTRELKARVADLESKVDANDAKAMLTRVEAMLQAITAGSQVAMTPALAPVADEIMRGAGFEDQAGQDPNIVQPEQQPMPQDPMQQAMPDMPPQPAQTGFNPGAPA